MGGPLNIVPLTLKHLTPKFLFWGPFRPKQGAKKHLAPFLDQLSVLENQDGPFKEIRRFTSAFIFLALSCFSQDILGDAHTFSFTFIHI